MMRDKNIDKKVLKVLLNKKYNRIRKEHLLREHVKVLLCSFKEYNKHKHSKKEIDDIIVREFVKALLTPSRTKIDETADAKEKFENIIKKLHVNKKGKIDLKEFFEHLKTYDEHPHRNASIRIQKIVDILSQRIKKKKRGKGKTEPFLYGMGYKTASIFLRNTIYCLHLFHNVRNKDLMHMRIPVDVNVIGVINAIYGKNFKETNKDKEKIDKLAEHIFESHPEQKIKFDNLWFFGNFYFCKGILKLKNKRKKKKRKLPKGKRWCALNIEKMEIDLKFDYKLRAEFKAEFQEVVHEKCPFSSFCKMYKKIYKK